MGLGLQPGFRLGQEDGSDGTWKLFLPATAVAEEDWDDRLGSKMTVEDREGKYV